MQTFRSKISYLLFVAVVAGCGTLTEQTVTYPKGIDGVACVGALPAVPPGFDETVAPDLLRVAEGATDKGGICAGKVITALAKVRVYRVFDQQQGSSTYGRWWSFTRPAATRQDYRSAYAICKEWSALDRLVSCAVKPAAAVVIGLTQSVACSEETFPKSDNLQVFIPNNRTTDTLYVEDCVDEGEWP